MAELLTKIEKIQIAESHKRNVEMNKWNLELSLIEENAVATPNTEIVASLTLQIADAAARLTAINAEIESLTE